MFGLVDDAHRTFNHTMTSTPLSSDIAATAPPELQTNYIDFSYDVDSDGIEDDELGYESDETQDSATIAYVNTEMAKGTYGYIYRWATESIV